MFPASHELNVQPAFERSFKIQENAILANRFLLGFEKDLIKERANEKILDMCEQLGMPADLMAAFVKHLPEASIVGFGFGENENTCTAKAYLEFGMRYYRAMRDKSHDPDPYLSHLGFKWDVSDNRAGIVTNYTCHPAYRVGHILERLSRDVYANHRRNPFDIVKGILDSASSKAGEDKFLYLSVHEEGNLRNSFDINLYRAKLRIEDIYPLLLDLCRFYSISMEPFRDLYDGIKAQTLGHIAGGVDRKGKDFLTLYFGA